MGSIAELRTHLSAYAVPPKDPLWGVARVVVSSRDFGVVHSFEIASEVPTVR
jgi:hypothetical protein